MTLVGEIGHNLTCPPQGPGGEQVLERWQIAPNHLLSRTNYTLQSAFVLGSGSSLPDGGGEDGSSLGLILEHFLKFLLKCFVRTSEDLRQIHERLKMCSYAAEVF